MENSPKGVLEESLAIAIGQAPPDRTPEDPVTRGTRGLDQYILRGQVIIHGKLFVAKRAIFTTISCCIHLEW